MRVKGCSYALFRRPAALEGRRPTLLLKSLLLLAGNLLFTALIWALSGAILPKSAISIALLAWSLGLRHGADADHISVIDNTVRRIIADGKTPRNPVTTGLFFSMGHSTVVVVVTIIIAVSISIADNLDAVENVGGIVGPAVSGSMLMLLAIINLGILISTIRRLRRIKLGEEKAQAPGETPRPTSCLTRAAWPLLRATDRPWKLFPVGLAMSIGFDTTSSIILLSVSAVAAIQGDRGEAAPRGAIFLLALLFTAGMCLVDSADSIMMCYVYAPQEARYGRKLLLQKDVLPSQDDGDLAQAAEKQQVDEQKEVGKQTPGEEAALTVDELEKGAPATPMASESVFTSSIKLSLVTTTLSIALAFTIGLIQLMSLIAEQCAECAAAAERQDETGDGGLAGRWWSGWLKAADNGWIGIGIVAFFAASLAGFALYTGIRAWRSKRTDAKL